MRKGREKEGERKEGTERREEDREEEKGGRRTGLCVLLKKI